MNSPEGLLLRVLGTQTPYPRKGSACSGYVVESQGTAIVLDLGAGTLAELTLHRSMLTVDAVVLTHNHADHSSDLLVAYYALAFSELRPAKQMIVFGPSDWDVRMEAFLSSTSPNPMSRVFDVRKLNWDEAASIGSLELSWAAVEHGVEAYACRVSGDEATVAYSGDTRSCDALVKIAAGADLFVCEAGADAREDPDTGWHLTPEDAGDVATRAGVGSLLLTHLAPGLSAEAAASRAALHFAGTVEVAIQGRTYRAAKNV
jgi:ribonuclease BN (tRNA processing enzyme)